TRSDYSSMKPSGCDHEGMRVTSWAFASLFLVLSSGAAVSCAGNPSTTTGVSAGSTPGIRSTATSNTGTSVVGSYSDEVRDNFLTGCTGSFEVSAATVAASAFCRCAYDYFV